MGRVSPSSQNQSGKGGYQPRKPPAPTYSPRGSRYSSGNPGGPGQFDISEIFSSSNNSDNRRGSGVKGRGGVDFGVLKPKSNSGRRSRYSSGAKGTAAATGAATGSQLSAVQPSIEELRSRQNAAIKAYGPTTSDVDNGGGGGNGRGETRESPTGVEQTGTNTGFKPMTIGQANLLLSDGYKFDEGYDSNQLPTTATNLYDADPETVQFETGGIEGINTGASQQTLTRDLFNEGGAVTFTEPTKNFPTSARIEATQTEGSANLVQSGDGKGTDWLNRSALDNSDKNLARRRAFLDAESSLQGLRDAEATQNIVYAGGQHNLLNPNRGKDGENDFIPITGVDAGSDIRGYKSGRLSAEDLKNKYVTAVKEQGDTAELPANIPNLPVQSEQPSTVTPVDTSAPQDFTVPENTEETVSKIIKLKSNLFK